jgi:hypothetical protein
VRPGRSPKREKEQLAVFFCDEVTNPREAGTTSDACGRE